MKVTWPRLATNLSPSGLVWSTVEPALTMAPNAWTLLGTPWRKMFFATALLE
jgi:hypothetical protein